MAPAEVVDGGAAAVGAEEVGAVVDGVELVGVVAVPLVVDAPVVEVAGAEVAGAAVVVGVTETGVGVDCCDRTVGGVAATTLLESGAVITRSAWAASPGPTRR